MPVHRRIIHLFFLLSLILVSCNQPTGKVSQPTDTAQASAVPNPALPLASQPTAVSANTHPFTINQDRLFSFLDGLTSIRPYAGWRLSASDGELDGLRYVEQEMKGLSFLNSLGVTFEWQEFHVPISLQIHEVTLKVSRGDTTLSIPANGLRGWRSSIAERLNMDSDGLLNDNNPDPMIVNGKPLVIQNRQQLDDVSLPKNRVIFLDYQLLMTDDYSGNVSSSVKQKLEALDPAAIVIVTTDSNEVAVNHGTFANEIGPVLNKRVPVIQIRSENVKNGDLTSWNLLARISAAEVTWDTDLFAPGTSHNLVVRVPGKDSSKAMILSAHIDSVANPGAMDDGSGSAALLEIAHVLNESNYQPAIDLYFAWFGSEELGLYGSTNFVNTHQDLLDHTVANLNFDCLSRPLNNVQANIQLAFWPGNYYEKDASRWVNSLTGIAQKQGIESHKMIVNIASDNSSFDAYDVPNLDLIYDADDEMNGIGGVWYGGHIHDPYDTVSKARDSAEIFTQMTQIALQGVLAQTSKSNYRTTGTPRFQALFIATHTEPPLMTPTGLADFSLVLAKSAFDVDLIPYKQSFTNSDLSQAKIVFVMPIADFPSGSSDLDQYDESWTNDDIQALKSYVENGGVLVITNSSQVTGFYGDQQDDNEDWGKMNALAAIFGITYTTPAMNESSADLVSGSPLSNQVKYLDMMPGEVVGFSIQQGQIIAGTQNATFAALIPFGSGSVIALADHGMFASGYSGLLNEQFISNILDFAASK